MKLEFIGFTRCTMTNRDELLDMLAYIRDQLEDFYANGSEYRTREAFLKEREEELLEILAYAMHTPRAVSTYLLGDVHGYNWWRAMRPYRAAYAARMASKHPEPCSDELFFQMQDSRDYDDAIGRGIEA